jgi:DNA-binding beta-propeller fold protein YncE
MRTVECLATATAVVLLGLGVSAATRSPDAGGYHEVHRYLLGGDGGWDYLALDTAGHRLFIARQDRIMVVDPETGKLLAEIPGLNRAHGVAFDHATSHGFASSGGDGMVVMFDLQTLKTLGKAAAAPDCDAILYDPASKRVFTFNGDAHSATAIDPATGKAVGAVDLGAKPEFGVSAGDGKLYVNLESSSEVAEVDAAALKVTKRWSIEPCQSPSGLAIDVSHRRLFSVCHSKVMGVSDLDAGRLVTTVPIGAGVDAARFDPDTGEVFASNGDGTLTVVHEDSPDAYHVVQTIETMRGARTMEIDPSKHRLYTASAEFGPMPPSNDGRRHRPPIVPGTFRLLVYER